MDLSVVVASHNRAESLNRTLCSIAGSNVPRRLRWELIVVDNNSDDGTQDIVRRHAKSCHCRIGCIKENMQGISHARNSGIQASRGRVIAFTDDDVVVDRFWMQNIMAAFDKHAVLCVGGKILPIWETSRPKWLKENLYGPLALLNYGDKARYLEKPKLWGANMAVASDAFRKYGLFSTRRGRTPNKLYGHEDTHFIQKLLAAQESVLYTPDAVVYHYISPDRMKKSYFRKWRFDAGEQSGFLIGDYPQKNLGGIPFPILRRLALHSVRCLFHVLTSSSKAFESELRVAGLLGLAAGRLKYRYRPLFKKTK